MLSFLSHVAKRLARLTMRSQRVTICPPLGEQISQRSVGAQGSLIDAMSNHYREYDDLDCILRDALRSNEAVALNSERSFVALRDRLAGKDRPAYRPWSLASPGWTSSYMSASYWYFTPLTRGMR